MSGNPAGKPKGARHRATMAVQELLEGEAEALTRKCVDLAMAGETTALRLCMERLAPAVKSRAVNLRFPPIKTVADILEAQAATIGAMRLEPDPGPTPGIVHLTEPDYESVVAKLLEQHAPSALWVFAYGSLIWKPEFTSVEHDARPRVAGTGPFA